MAKEKEQALDDLIMDEGDDSVSLNENNEETNEDVESNDYYNAPNEESNSSRQLVPIDTMVLTSDEYSEFFRIISIFSDLCNDVDIRDGIIRQRINDNISVFEIDLTPMVGILSIPISNLKQKLDLFKCFVGQEVTINNDGVSYRFSDRFSSLKFLLPHLELLDNKYITEEDLNQSMSMLPEHLLLKTSVSKVISDRIKIVSKGFNTNSLLISLGDGKASISSTTQSKEQSAKFMNDIVTEQVVDCKTNVSVTPFIIDHDNEIILQVYENENNRALNEFKTTISDININIYCRSNLLREGD